MRIFKSLSSSQQLFLGVITGAYFAFIFLIFKEKILNIGTLELGALGSFLGGIFAPILFTFITFQHFSQQEQILDSRKKEREREDEKKRLAQPIFEFKNNHIEQTNDGEKEFTKINFELTNHASDATNISISILPTEDTKPYYSKKLFKLSCNETDNILITFDYFDLEHFDIEVRYFDSLRLPNVKFYSCQKSQHDEYGSSFSFNVIEKK
ncbi:hypothetical protein [Marinomonas sp.]|uniref:hypothetical protein n=1 Tax=Marinomonas sp. TaxID=1904862 RepID=UPI003A8F4226